MALAFTSAVLADAASDRAETIASLKQQATNTCNALKAAGDPAHDYATVNNACIK